MKFYTLDKTILMDIASVKPHDQGIVIEGKIMGTMPMKAVLHPSELRAGLRFATPRILWSLIRMLFRSDPR